jgi:hypothetical protein
MSKWKSSTLILLFALLIIVPILVDAWVMRGVRIQYMRDDDLKGRFDCEPVERCVADFNGDGIPASFDVNLTAPVGGDLIVNDGGREILRLPYDHTDGTLRTHIAVIDKSGKSRLLVYDGASHQPPLKAAFDWDGEKLAQVSTEAVDSEIISAMAAHDDTGGWNERAFSETFRGAKLAAYYFGLTIFIGVIVYQRWRNPAAKLA